MLTYDGRNRRTVNYLKTLYFDRPEWTPCRVSFLPAAWMLFRERLEEVVLAHPRVFPGYRKKRPEEFDAVWNPLYELGRITDSWGTVWENVERGMDAHPVEYPLGDWSAFETYRPPDPFTQDLFGPRASWEKVRADLAAAKAKGNVALAGPLWHGHMYMRLFYLRGFENLMFDIGSNDPRLPRLIRMVEEHNVTVVEKTVECGAEMLHFGDDLGMQTALPMSPTAWRQWIKPAYGRVCAPARDRGLPIYLHTDGHILEIIPDLIDVGVTIVNPQIRANGLEGLQRMAKGKVCIDQDLDRQLWPFATKRQIEEHIGTVFDGLYDPRGGLMMLAECGQDVPPDKVDTICTVFERLCKPPMPE